VPLPRGLKCPGLQPHLQSNARSLKPEA
jgi:hypothetical protein